MQISDLLKLARFSRGVRGGGVPRGQALRDLGVTNFIILGPFYLLPKRLRT